MKLTNALCCLLLGSLGALTLTATAPDAAPLSPAPKLEKKPSWLELHQNVDGSFGQARKVEITSLALLAYQAHFETCQSKSSGKNLAQMIGFLATAKAEDRLSQTLQLCALAEAREMNPQIDLAAVVDKAARTLIDGKADQDNPAILAWTSRAYESAGYAACREEGLLEAYIRTHERLKTLALAVPADAESRGAVFYAMTRSQRLWNEKGKISEEFQPLIDKIFSVDLNSLNWQEAPPRAMSAWFFATHGAFSEGGARWNQWRKVYEPMLRKNQNPEGFWNPPGIAETSDEEVLEATAYACFSLAVYSRIIKHDFPSSRSLGKEAEKLGWQLPTAKP